MPSNQSSYWFCLFFHDRILNNNNNTLKKIITDRLKELNATNAVNALYTYHTPYPSPFAPDSSSYAPYPSPTLSDLPSITGIWYDNILNNNNQKK